MLSMFSIFINWPWLAALPVFIFFLLRRRTPSKAITIAGVLWLAYLIWELMIWAGIGCDGGCDIRVDLLLIAPLLILVSLIAFWQALRGRE